MITPRKTWSLVAAAGALFCFIFFFERHIKEEVQGPAPILSGLNPAQIGAVQVIPAHAGEIRAERVNGAWRLVRPVDYPANGQAIEALLQVFSLIKPQARISAAELADSADPDAEFGFDSPQATVIVQQDGRRVQIQLGRATVMGDQAFLRIVGADNVNIVTADLLRIIPTHEHQWRDLQFFNWGDAVVDRLVITNGPRVIEFQRDSGSAPWRMARPMEARADSAKLNFLLDRLQATPVAAFVEDGGLREDEVDFELNPPALSLVLANGTNRVAQFQVGRSIITNGFAGTYARRLKRPGTVLVPTAPLVPWQANYNEFRDRHLVSIAIDAVDSVSISGLEDFTLSRVSNDVWRVSGPADFVADPGLVRELFSVLNDLTVSEFVKDVVTEPDLPTYGLAPPSRTFVLKSGTGAAAPATDGSVVARIEFGRVQGDKIFVRRADESPVYALAVPEFSRLPAEAWQFRKRRIWNFSTNDIVRLIVQDGGRKRELIREGPYKWTFASGSEGVIQALAVEEVAAALGELTAASWVDQGTKNRARLGFQDPAPTVTVEVRQGGETKQMSVEFGGFSPSEFPYAATTIDGRHMIFEFPWKLYQDLHLYVFPPAGAGP